MTAAVKEAEDYTCTAPIWKGDAEKTANGALTEWRRPGWDVR